MAPFAARPDTVDRGDLRGPFEGRVTDADSGQPVEGAAVLVSWAFETGRGLYGPAAALSAVEETDADGHYLIPRAALGGAASGRVARVTLVFYKKGYVAWRSDQRFSDLSPRHDFFQTGNQVKLDRLPADVSHARHLAFVGAGGPLLERLAWELPLAGAEVTTPVPPSEAAASSDKPGESGGGTLRLPPPDPHVLISADELRAVTGSKSDFADEPLPDAPAASHYNSLHFRAVGEDERHDAALRLYRLTPDEAARRYQGLVTDLPSVEEKNEVGDKSLRTHEGDIFAVAALEKTRGFVLVFTCGNALCADAEMVTALVKRMWPHLARIPTAVAPAPSESQP